MEYSLYFFFSSRRRHTRCYRDWSSDVCSSDLERPAAAQGAIHDWMTHLCGRNIESAQLLLEFFRVVHHCSQIGERDELAIVEQPPDEAGVAVAALLAVADDIHAGSKLSFHRQPHCIIRGRLKLLFRKPPLEALVNR